MVRHVVVGLLLLCGLLSVTAEARIHQYFDQEGNIASHRSVRKAGPELKTHRYTIPEGVKLRDDVFYEYYPVFGRTISELVISSAENGPFDEKEKKRVPSRTQWILGWSYEIQYAYVIDQESRTVHVSAEVFDITPEYDISITLPTLIDTTVLNPIEKNLWQNYFQQLLGREHERVNLLTNAQTQKELIASLEDIGYLTFDYKSEINIGASVEQMIRDETLQRGRRWVEEMIRKEKKLKAKSSGK